MDRRAGELRKRGVKIRLQDQPCQILLMLLERPGDVVTREDIQTRLWPSGTIVEFEHSIGTAIKKLRQALGDDAETPATSRPFLAVALSARLTRATEIVGPRIFIAPELEAEHR